ncbi:sensor histidine kinase [Archangium sp.]|uniref:sensor histidine kinase n=1 Tax=Archangium sp. TaxID=1872627 RepID=UPI002D2A761A|nr:ATP-binding protein [Archangium sp.]HYO52022.1 ATP-binding protein [Archangium sp.]
MSRPGVEVEESEIAADRIHTSLKWSTLGAVIVTHLLLVGSIWGQWGRIALISGVFALATVLNNVLVRRFRFFSESARLAENLRVALNLLVTPVYGHFTDWAMPVWFYLPLNSVWVDSTMDRLARPRLLVMLMGVAVVAMLDGCPPLVPLTFVLISMAVGAISEARAQLMRLATQRLARRHEELARAHEELDKAWRRAREQDRLSSLGVLAASIAHEINNPMSYVKSNVNALFEDMREHPALPAELQEYVTDVLPATVDGIQRICAIVSDLRRFSRGETEQMVEYDLNAEVEAALRITRGQLQMHGGVEVDLGPLPRLRGNPRQISQVVINLLVNAAQALAGRSPGKVFVSTRQEADTVVLTVRDTGMGMGPEVLARLFHPFFTTKPVGEGTGIGLMVVHDIVAAHGGHIEVKSQLQQGSTFIIRLPYVPVLSAEPPSTPGASRATSVYRSASKS